MQPHTYDPQRKLFLPTREKNYSDRMAERNMQFVAGFTGVAGLLASNYDGTNDFITGAGTVADNKLLSKSIWLRPTDLTGAHFFWGSSGASRLLNAFSGAKLQIRFDTDAGAQILFKPNFSTVTINIWTHLLLVVDMDDSAKTWLFKDDVDITPAWNNFDTGTALNLSFTDWEFGASGGGSKFQGDISEIYVNPGYWFDASVAANRRKFITAAGKPADLGSDGSNPSSSQPIVYNPAGDEVNVGSLSDFTVTGALVSAPGPGA